MRVAIVGAGLAGLTAVELADAGWEVEIFESLCRGLAVGLMRMVTMLRWGCTSFWLLLSAV